MRTAIPISIVRASQWPKYSRNIHVARAQTGSNTRRHALRGFAEGALLAT